MDTLEALKLFVCIAETGSLSAAARRLSIATSTVTVALQQLEERAGTGLITRSTRNLVFTPEGRQFLSDARRLLADWETSIAGVKGGPLRGPIRLTASQDFGRHEVVPLIDKFLALHPEVQVSLHLSDDNVDMLEQDIDIALRNGPLVDSSLRARLLLRGKRVVCAAPGYWEKHGRPHHPNDLAKFNCLVLSRSGTNQGTWPFAIFGTRVSIRVTGDRVVNDSGVVRDWAIRGHGVLMRSPWGIIRELESGALETVLDDYSADNGNLYAVTTGGMSSHRVRAFIDFLAAELVGRVVKIPGLSNVEDTLLDDEAVREPLATAVQVTSLT